MPSFQKEFFGSVGSVALFLLNFTLTKDSLRRRLLPILPAKSSCPVLTPSLVLSYDHFLKDSCWEQIALPIRCEAHSMTEPTMTHATPSSEVPSITLFSIVRWALGLVVTALFSYPILFAWVFVSIRGMPQKITLIQLAFCFAAVAVITVGLFRSSGNRRWQVWGVLLLVVVWIASCTAVALAVLDQNVGDPIRLGPFFGMCTLVFPALLWLGAWSGSCVRNAAITGLLAVGIPLFHQWARIDGLSGDETKVSMAWRQTTREISASTPVVTKDTQYSDFPQFLGPNRDGRLDAVSLVPDWHTHPPKLLWKHPIGSGLGAFAVVGNHAVTLQQIGPEEAISCYDLRGEDPLGIQVPGAFRTWAGQIGAASTPTLHEERVLGIGGAGDPDLLEP